MVATLFLIRSSSNLQITGTDIKSWTSLILARFISMIVNECPIEQENVVLMIATSF